MPARPMAELAPPFAQAAARAALGASGDAACCRTSRRSEYVGRLADGCSGIPSSTPEAGQDASASTCPVAAAIFCMSTGGAGSNPSTRIASLALTAWGGTAGCICVCVTLRVPAAVPAPVVACAPTSSEPGSAGLVPACASLLPVSSKPTDCGSSASPSIRLSKRCGVSLVCAFSPCGGADAEKQAPN